MQYAEAGAVSRHNEAVSEPDEKDELFGGPSLSADGRLEQRMGAVEAASSAEPFAPPPEPELELAERGPKATRAPEILDFRPAPRRMGGAAKAMIALVALGVVLLVAFIVFKPTLDAPTRDGVSAPTVLDQLNLGERHPVMIDSTPGGAKLTIDGVVVGETPWAGDNRWTGEVRVVVQARGYKPWEGVLSGGQPVTLNVTLAK